MSVYISLTAFSKPPSPLFIPRLFTASSAMAYMVEVANTSMFWHQLSRAFPPLLLAIFCHMPLPVCISAISVMPPFPRYRWKKYTFFWARSFIFSVLSAVPSPFQKPTPMFFQPTTAAAVGMEASWLTATLGFSDSVALAEAP